MEPERRDYGPSWWDCERLMQQLKRDFNREEFRIALGMVTDPHNGKVYWVVTVQSAESWYPVPKGVIGSSYQFKGNTGASTFPAALHMALAALWDKLDDRKNRAEQAALF